MAISLSFITNQYLSTYFVKILNKIFILMFFDTFSWNENVSLETFNLPKYLNQIHLWLDGRWVSYEKDIEVTIISTRQFNEFNIK